MIFTVVLGYQMSTNTLGYMESYQTNCDQSFHVPELQFIEPKDNSYYFENPDATCDKLHFLIYFMGGLSLFVVGAGLFTLSRFLIECEVSIVVRKRF